jgi:hypothetical protein
MANMIIKPAADGNLLIQDRAGGAVLSTGTSGATIANATLSGSVTGVLGAGVTGGSGLEISQLVGIMHAADWNTATNYVTLANNKTYDVINHGHSKAQFTYYIVGIDRWVVSVNGSGVLTQVSRQANQVGFALDLSTANALRINALNSTNRPGVVYVFERGLTMDID